MLLAASLVALLLAQAATAPLALVKADALPAGEHTGTEVALAPRDPFFWSAGRFHFGPRPRPSASSPAAVVPASASVSAAPAASSTSSTPVDDPSATATVPAAGDAGTCPTSSAETTTITITETAPSGAAPTEVVLSSASSASALSPSPLSSDPSAPSSSTLPAADPPIDTGDRDPQTSPVLSPEVIAPGLAQDGQNPGKDGQVASRTSTNNFINFCLTRPELVLTNGQQVIGGSCNPVPMGIIVGRAVMPSCKFVSPPNLGTVKAAETFTIQMRINNLETGNFVNATSNYYSGAATPAFTNSAGILVGHSHVVIESIPSLSSTEPTDPTKFAFFKGLNFAAQDGLLSADVTGGLAPGAYRMSSINSAANHQPALVAVAQRGALDDASYFQVTEDGLPAVVPVGEAAAAAEADAASALEPAESAAAAARRRRRRVRASDRHSVVQTI